MRATLLSFLLLGAAALSPFADADEPKATPPALATSGSLSLVEDGFYQLSYLKPVAGKKKPKAFKAYLRVTEDTTWYADAAGRVADLAKDASLWIYGDPVESESVNDSGQSVVDRQIRGVLAIATGEALPLKELKVKKGPRWIKATVSKTGQALQVNFDGNDYRVLTARNCPVLIRKKLEKKPAKLKKKLKAAVIAEASEDRPKKAKAKIGDSFVATALVLFNKRLGAAYGLMRQAK